MFEGLVQHDHPLRIHHILDRMLRISGDAQIATLTDDGVERATHVEVAERAGRLAAGLAELGVRPGDRVGTFCWNTQRHVEAYLAVPCMGAVLHTLNLRLFEDQLVYIVNHAQDKVIIVDDSLVPILEKVADRFRPWSTTCWSATVTAARCRRWPATRSCSPPTTASTGPT